MCEQGRDPLTLPTLLPWVVGIVAAALLITYAVTFHQLPINEHPPAWGAFGDYLGGVLNPLVSAFTLLVAVKVWQLQKNELEETRRALSEQASTAERQRQEQRFFDLLNVYFRTVDALRFDVTIGGYGSAVNRDSFYGKDALRQWFLGQGAIKEFLRDKGAFYNSGNPETSNALNAQYVASLGREWRKTDQANRFDTLLRTIEAVFSTAANELHKDPRTYLDLLKVQLSDDELSLIGFQLLYEQCPPTLRALVEQFALLENMPRSDLHAALENTLPPTAFASAKQTLAVNWR